MRKRTKIFIGIAIFLILLGSSFFVVAMFNLNWDFTKFTTYNYQSKTYDVSQNYTNIYIDNSTVDIKFIPSSTNQTTVTCYTQEKIENNIFVEDDTLKIISEDKRQWFDFMGIGFSSGYITISLPRKAYDDITVNSKTSDVYLQQLQANNISIFISTGDTNLENIDCNNLLLNISTGKSKLKNINCSSFNSTGSTGDITLKNFIANGKINIDRTTGDIAFNDCDANEIYAKTSTGDIEGTLLNPKTFVVSTTTGKKIYPTSSQGGRCELKTTTGDITISIK